jgi:LCP family protein required for cell wall assembly
MKNSKHNKKKTAFIIIGSIVLVIAIFIAGGALYTNHILNQIVDGSNKETRIANPDITTDAPLPSQYVTADQNIKKNIEDNRMWYNKNIINVLLIGCDNGSSTQYYPRSDSVIIASLNKIDKVINIVSLSRATYVAIPGHGHARLNAAYAYGGPDLLIKTVEENYKVRIDNYISVDFNGFSKIIDTLGGVTVPLTAAELKYYSALFAAKGIDISAGPGNYTLDGQLALEYARTRKIDSDKQRTQRQRNIITQMIKKAKSSSLSQLNKLMTDFLPLVSTNFSKSELVSQAANALTYSKWPVKEAIIPHTGTSLVMVDGYEVLMFNWNVVKSDIHEQLYPGIEPQTVTQP